MPEVIILGTMAIDSVETPFGKAPNALGGSATFASFTSSFFTKPGIVSIIGIDFPEEHLTLLKNRGISLEGVKKHGKTFRWEGSYEFDMNEAKTKKTELNALAEFDPQLPESYRDANYIFLGNLDPEIHLKVLSQIKNPKLAIMDTMNFWIQSKKESLLKVIKKVNILLLNDSEARQLFQTPNLVKAANMALKLGPEAVIIKKGEHGALLFTKEKHFSAPSYPLENIKDPTGCGDSFGGALIGYLAKTNDHSEPNLRKAVIYGSVLASFNAEDFSLNRLKTLTHKDIESRYQSIKNIIEF